MLKFTFLKSKTLNYAESSNQPELPAVLVQVYVTLFLHTSLEYREVVFGNRFFQVYTLFFLCFFLVSSNRVFTTLFCLFALLVPLFVLALQLVYCVTKGSVRSNRPFLLIYIALYADK